MKLFLREPLVHRKNRKDHRTPDRVGDDHWRQVFKSPEHRTPERTDRSDQPVFGEKDSLKTALSNILDNH